MNESSFAMSCASKINLIVCFRFAGYGFQNAESENVLQYPANYSSRPPQTSEKETERGSEYERR